MKKQKMKLLAIATAIILPSIAIASMVEYSSAASVCTSFPLCKHK